MGVLEDAPLSDDICKSRLSEETFRMNNVVLEIHQYESNLILLHLSVPTVPRMVLKLLVKLLGDAAPRTKTVARADPWA